MTAGVTFVCEELSSGKISGWIMVQLSLNLVTSDVVVSRDLLIQDQVFCWGWKPAQTEKTFSLWTSNELDGVWLYSIRSQTFPSTLCSHRFSNRLWSHVNHQFSRVLCPPRLVSRRDERLNSVSFSKRHSECLKCKSQIINVTSSVVGWCKHLWWTRQTDTQQR